MLFELKMVIRVVIRRSSAIQDGRIFEANCMLVECCRSQRGQPAWWSVCQRAAATGLDETTYRRAGTQRSPTVRHLQDAPGLSAPHSRADVGGIRNTDPTHPCPQPVPKLAKVRREF